MACVWAGVCIRRPRHTCRTGSTLMSLMDGGKFIAGNRWWVDLRASGRLQAPVTYRSDTGASTGWLWLSTGLHQTATIQFFDFFLPQHPLNYRPGSTETHGDGLVRGRFNYFALARVPRGRCYSRVFKLRDSLRICSYNNKEAATAKDRLC